MDGQQVHLSAIMIKEVMATGSYLFKSRFPFLLNRLNLTDQFCKHFVLIEIYLHWEVFMNTGGYSHSIIDNFI